MKKEQLEKAGKVAAEWIAKPENQADAKAVAGKIVKWVKSLFEENKNAKRKIKRKKTPGRGR